jgi:hypothetical protein
VTLRRWEAEVCHVCASAFQAHPTVRLNRKHCKLTVAKVSRYSSTWQLGVRHNGVIPLRRSSGLKTRRTKLRARLHRAVSHLHQMVENAWLSIDREIVALVQSEEVEPARKLLRRATVCPTQADLGSHTRSSTAAFDRTLYFGGAAYRSPAPI